MQSRRAKGGCGVQTLNGIGLLVIGIAVPTLGLQLLGNGDFAQGLSTLTSAHQKNSMP